MARREYDRALELDPGYAEVWNNIGTLEQAAQALQAGGARLQEGDRDEARPRDALEEPRQRLPRPRPGAGGLRGLPGGLPPRPHRSSRARAPGIPAAGIDAATQSYYLAKLLAANGQTDAAIDFLRRAKEAGFRDFARVALRPGLPRRRRRPALQGRSPPTR